MYEGILKDQLDSSGMILTVTQAFRDTKAERFPCVCGLGKTK
jgi:hypothetical protein